MNRCEVNAAERDEDVGCHITYRPCGRRAAWYSEDPRVHADGLHMCRDHKDQIAMRVDDDVAFQPVTS